MLSGSSSSLAQPAAGVDGWDLGALGLGATVVNGCVQPSGSSGQIRRAVTDEIMAAIQHLFGQDPADGYNELSVAA
ncbi:hypothetical protein [Micromonospora sp. RTP1Z1]|uniref:hypothetical protein n=1 Tax=Micromonospora sp. RTP1Z1 TaxID=2994043 RepID=UPI0029C8AC35|nr:hypothetical protein [Micromonospora sp. RTP1Z1]